MRRLSFDAFALSAPKINALSFITADQKEQGLHLGCELGPVSLISDYENFFHVLERRRHFVWI
jgi:hypothetical protein